MIDEKIIINEIVKNNRQMILGVHECFDKIDSHYGRRIAVIEGQTDLIVKMLDSLGKELREQYHSIGRRNDLLELQVIKQLNERNINNKQMSAKEILGEIEIMRNEERWMLLDELFNKYYDKGGRPKAELDKDY
jgi:hypothetical protein